jgi:hypothetical protein
MQRTKVLMQNAARYRANEKCALRRKGFFVYPFLISAKHAALAKRCILH